MRHAALWVLCAWGLTGCEGTQLRAVQARILASAADECLYDVRDRRLTYETSPNCSRLGDLAGQCIAVGGFKDINENPSHAELAGAPGPLLGWPAQSPTRSPTVAGFRSGK